MINSPTSATQAHISTHLLAEFWGATVINDPVQAKDMLCCAAREAKATVLGEASYGFTPQGVTAVVLLGESHISMHTWPEKDYIAVDIFTCGNSNCYAALQHLEEVLQPKKVDIQKVKRGNVAVKANNNVSTTNTPMSDQQHSWFWENTVPGKRNGNVGHGFKMERVLYQGETPFQKVLIFDNKVYGRTLVLDNIIQLTDVDEFIYHEMLVHPVMLSHPNPRRILVVGGGDGGTLRECLRYDVEEVVLAEIDAKIIELCREHMPQVSKGAFDNPKVKVVLGDAQDVVANSKEHFDVIIIDCNDPIGPSEALYGKNFYQSVHEALKPDGMISVQVGSLLDQPLLQQTYQRLGEVFAHLSSVRLTMPSYNCGEYCFMSAAKNLDMNGIALEELKERLNSRLTHSDMRYYTPEVQVNARLLPPYMQLS